MKSKAETNSRPQSEFRRPCAACGTSATRAGAKFCRVCGKTLTEEYQPLDRWRASYSFRKKEFAPVENEETGNLFDENRNPAAATAAAFVVYSLVPFLGILFCPGAFLMGGIGAFQAYRKPFLGGGRASLYSVVSGAFIFAAQIFLWWLLFIVPELRR